MKIKFLKKYIGQQMMLELIIMKAAFLSVWDSEKKESLRIDLWTKDMPLDEMKIFFYQILTSMSSTFKRATQDEKMSQTMLDFCDYFAEKLEIKK